MRILIVTTFFPPLNSTASLRPYSWAKYWSRGNHDVTVLTTTKLATEADVRFPCGDFRVIEVPLRATLSNLKQSYNSQMRRSESGTDSRFSLRQMPLNCVNYIRNKRGIFNATRMPDLTELWVPKAWQAINKEGPWDLVVSTAGPYTTHILAQKIKNKKLARFWVADYRDLWVDSHIYPGMWPFTLYERYLERKIAEQADLTTTVSEPLAQHLSSKYPQARVEVVENGYDPCDFEQLPSETIFPNDGKVRIVYTGSVYYPQQNPLPLFNAIYSLSKNPQRAKLIDSLEIIFVGDTKATIQPLIDKCGVGRWVFHRGKIPREDALRMQRDSHGLLFLPHEGAQGILSGKLFEYLYAGTPIVCIGAQTLCDVQKLICSLNVGTALGCDLEAISLYLVRELLRSEKQSVVACQKGLKQFSREHLAQHLLDLVKNGLTIPDTSSMLSSGKLVGSVTLSPHKHSMSGQ